MLDIIATPERPIEIATDTPASITMMPGGSGANQAAWLGYFGNDVRFIGRVGAADHALHARALGMHGVESYLARDEHARTGTLVTLIGAAGERSFLTDRGANAHMCRADLSESLLHQAALIHVSGYALFSREPRTAVRAYLELARARGIRISVDCGSVAFLRDIGATAFLEWTHGASICFANSTEASLIAGTEDPAEQCAVFGAHYETLVVTHGANGAIASSDYGRRRHAIAAPAVAAIDTTGAGDAFVAGFLTAFVANELIDVCLRRGAAAGSAAVVRSGGRPPSPE